MRRGQPSTPPIQKSRGRWHPPLSSTTPIYAAPLYDPDMYNRDARRDPNRDPNLGPSKSSSRSSVSNENPMASSTISIPYLSPERMIAMQHSYGPSGPPLYGSPLHPTVGPPLYMAGGGYEIPVAAPHGGGLYALTSYPPQVPSMQYFGRNLEDRRHAPWLSVALAIGYTIIFIMTMQHNNCPQNTGEGGKCLLTFLQKFSFQPLSENPLLGPSAKTLLDMGALESELVTKAREGWRMLSSMWLHAGVFHIISNLLGLLSLGIPLERQLGYAKVGFLYILSGFVGSILSALFLHGRISVGPTGAGMGLVGATLSSILFNWNTHQHQTQSLISILFFVSLDLGLGLMPLVDNFMHIGGVVTGFLFGNLLFNEHNFGWITHICFRPSVVYDVDDMPVKSKSYVWLNIVWVVSFCALISSITMGLFALYTGMRIDKGCTWCKYLTCAPTHLWKCYGDHDFGCNPSSVQGYLRITCANGNTHDWPAMNYFDQLSPQVQGLCIKACV